MHANKCGCLDPRFHLLAERTTACDSEVRYYCAGDLVVNGKMLARNLPLTVAWLVLADIESYHRSQVVALVKEARETPQRLQREAWQALEALAAERALLPGYFCQQGPVPVWFFNRSPACVAR